MEEYADLPECRLLDKSLLHRRVKKELHEVFAELRSIELRSITFGRKLMSMCEVGSAHLVIRSEMKKLGKLKGEEKIYRGR